MRQTLLIISKINLLSKEDIQLTSNLPVIRSNRRTPGIDNAQKDFEVNWHNVILDTMVESIKKWFSAITKIYIIKLRALIPNGLKK